MADAAGLHIGDHAIASGPEEVEYLRWNDAVAKAFFGPHVAGELVHLDLDEKTLMRIGAEFGLDGPAALRALTDTVTPLLVMDGSRTPLFDRFNKLNEAWYRASRKQLDDLNRIGPPPVVALLALFALAGRHMSALAARTGNKAVSAFYLPLALLLQAGQENVKLVEAAHKRDAETYWEALRYWLELSDGQLGLPSAYAMNHRPVGLALSQNLFGESELRQLHRMFEDLELTTAQGMSAQELGMYVDFWLDIADTDVSKGMRRIWSNPLTRDAGLHVALAQLGAWESDPDEAPAPGRQRRGPHHLGSRIPSLSMSESTDYVGNPVFEFGFVVPKRQVSGREVELATTAGPRTVYLSYIGAAFLGISAYAARLDVEKLLTGQLTLTVGEDTMVRNPRPVVVFAKDAYADTFISVDHVPAAWPCRVMVRDEGQWVDQVRAILDDSASPDYHEISGGERGVPEGWVVFDDVQVLRSGDPMLTADDNFSGLVPRLVPAVTLSGGLRIPGDVYRYSATRPPQATVTSDSDDPLSLEVEWRNPNTFKLMSAKLSEPRVPPFQVSLERSVIAKPNGRLKPNDYTLVLKSGRTARARVEFRVRDSSYYITQRSLGYEGEMLHTEHDPLWPVAAATYDELPEQYVQGSFDNMDHVDLPEGFEELELPAVAGWHSDEGQMYPERSNELPDPDVPSCLETGRHKVILPPMDPKSRAPWVFGRCRVGGMTKRYPGRLTKLSAVGQTGSVDALQFIGPDDGDYPGSWAAAKDLLTFLGGGKRSSLSIVARQLEDSERFEEWFVELLQSLGFLEVTRDPQTWAVKRWQVCSPALTQLVDGSVLFTGGWKPEQEEIVTTAAEALGADVVVVSPEDHSTTLLQNVDLEALHEKLPAGLCDVVYEAGPVMVDTLPVLSSVVSHLPLVEMQYNGVAERFVPLDATWEATDDRNQAGLYRVNHHHRTRYMYRTPEDIESGHAHPVSSGLGKHLVARDHGMALVSYDPSLRLLSVPIGAELPGLYARSAVLCSGMLPVRVDEDFSLNYGDISEDFAHVLLAKLRG